jgi:hypothetical protein
MASDHETRADFEAALRPDILKFPKVSFTDPLYYLRSLCYALAYAATDDHGGEAFVLPFLKAKTAQRELQEAMDALRERLL